MSRRTQIVVAAVLLAVLALVLYLNRRRAPELSAVLFTSDKVERLNIPDPTLRLDRLERLRKLEYSGPRRNIFSGRLPPPPPAPAPAPAVTTTATPLPPAVAPLQIPFRFYGYASDPASGRRRAFFTDGDNVFILYEGQMLQRQFRLLRIGNQAAEFEEAATGRRASLPLEHLPGQ